MTTINRETFVREWCNDLRSGEYTQGFNSLHDGFGGHCCLGVACFTGKRLGLRVDDYEFNPVTAKYPGGWFINLMGNWNPWVTRQDKTACVGTINDSRRFNFNQIADALEATFLNPAGAK